ncbi:MAG: arsenite methyltransferase [Myxococcota bacterium]
MDQQDVHNIVKAGYGAVARESRSCCGSPASEQSAAKMGYTESDTSGPAAAGNLGLGCGNPTALAGLREGEVVVDLGSGAGFDALLSAPRLGQEGRFIGVDMTPEMLERARKNAVDAGFARTVEFREGLIEDLPVASGTVDVVISNCVINLSPDKPQVFREAYRVLKSGGRLAVSDIVLSEALPSKVAQLASSWIACVGGASTEEAYLEHMRAAGFERIEYTRTPASNLITADLQDPMWQAAVEEIGQDQIDAIADTIFSYSITAIKP